MIINRTNLQSAYVGFNTAFQRGLDNVEAMYASVATTVPSATRSNEYAWLAKMPRIREWVGDRAINAIESEGYTIRNKSYELTIGVDRDDFDDDNLGIYTPMFEQLGNHAATFPDELVWPLLASGFDTPCYDGQYFFDSDHPVLDEDGNPTSVSNTGGGSGTAWYLMDVSRPLRPLIYQERKAFGNLVRKDMETDDNVFHSKQFQYGLDGRANVGFGFWQTAYGSRQTLNASSYEAARVALMGMKGDYGKPLAIRPRTLVVPPALEGAARELVGNQLTGNGGTNKWFGTADVMVVPWLA